MDVFPHSDRIIDLVSVGGGLDDGDGPSPVIVEIGGRWPELDDAGIWDHLRVDGPSGKPGHS